MEAQSFASWEEQVLTHHLLPILIRHQLQHLTREELSLPEQLVPSSLALHHRLKHEEVKQISS